MFSLFVIGIKTSGKATARIDNPAPAAVRTEASCPASLGNVAKSRIPLPERVISTARKEALTALAP